MPSPHPQPGLSRRLARPLAAALALATLVALATACGPRRGRTRATPVARITQDNERARDAWQRPKVVVSKLGLRPGMSVVDLGAGAGYLLPHLSRAVGAKGRVYAVEVEPALLTALRARVKRLGLRNVSVVRGEAADLPLPTLVDRVLLLNTYPELERPVELLAALRDRLKPTGRLAVIDFKPDADVPGPPPEERLAPESVVAEARGAGFVESLSFDVLPRQYFLLFIHQEETDAGDEALDAPDDPTPTNPANATDVTPAG